MPFDSIATDTLADIDKKKPLTLTSVKRIIRAVHAKGLLAMDHAHEFSNREPYIADRTPFMTPHVAVDTFLGRANRDSCPCNLNNAAFKYLEKLNNLHRNILFSRAVHPENPELQADVAKFAELLG